MELLRIRHFLAVVEAMHFGRAAEALGIAQPALSRSIKLLETDMGVRLFDRSLRQIRLTEAGQVLAREAGEIAGRVRLAEQLTRAAGGGAPRRLRIGFISSAVFGLLADGIRIFRRQYPDIELELVELTPTEQVRRLGAGDLDLCYLSRPLEGTNAFAAITVLPSAIVAAIPASWKLARRKTVRLAELGDLPFVLSPPHHSPTWRALVDTACRDAGFQPRVVQESQETLVVLGLVSGEIGVSLVHQEVRRMSMEGVSFVPVADAPAYLSIDLSLVWVERAMSDPLRSFVDIVRREGATRRKLSAASAGRARARR